LHYKLREICQQEHCLVMNTQPSCSLHTSSSVSIIYLIGVTLVSSPRCMGAGSIKVAQRELVGGLRKDADSGRFSFALSFL